jgi:hypothetical protein
VVERHPQVGERAQEEADGANDGVAVGLKEEVLDGNDDERGDAPSRAPTNAFTGAAPSALTRPRRLRPLMNKTEPTKNKLSDVMRLSPR